MSFFTSSLKWMQNSFLYINLYRAIVFTAGVFTLFLMFFVLHHAGLGQTMVFIPWFVPVIGLFNALSLFAVAFLAAGRFNVLNDPSSFWISMGSIGLGVALIFRALTWPGLLPDGGALIPGFPGAPLWLIYFGLTIFSSFLLISALVKWPTNTRLTGIHLVAAVAAWTAILIIAFSFFIHAPAPGSLVDGHRPALLLLVWSSMMTILFIAGAILSTRLYLKTGNPLPGYIAFAQMGIGFSLLIFLMGLRPYNLWWYLTHMLSTASVLVALFGILSEYVQVFRREKQGKEFMDFALESSNIGVWQINLDDHSAFQTIEHSRIFGYDRLLPDWTYETFLDHVLPEDRDKVNAIVREGTAKDANWSYECRIRRRDGEVRWISVTGSPKKDVMGNIRWVIGIVRDITEKKQVEEALRESEAHFRALLTSSSEVLYCMNPDWSEMRHLHSRGFLADTITSNPKWFNEYIPPKDQPHVKAVIDNAIRTRSIFELEHRVRQADGSIGWTFSRAVPILDERGEIMEWFGAAINITERKEAEQALQELNKRLEERVGERTELAESRTRLLQKLAVELIEAEEKERRRIAEFLHEDLQQDIVSARMQLQALAAGGEILKNVDQLLEETIEKSRRLAHELSPPALHQFGLSAGLEWLIRHMKDYFGMQVQFNQDLAHPVKDKALQVFIFRVLKELLFNSARHSGVKSAEVDLVGKGKTLFLSVRDRGSGFDPDCLDSDKNFGLGLISLQERTRALGGHMEIESAPGKGSQVTLSIPFDLAESRDSGICESTAEYYPDISIEKKADQGPQTIRVLFADDHKVMRQGLISMIADKPDIEVAGEAVSGEEALEMARRVRPDVIIMDISMPGMGGIEATRRIKAENPGIRVIGLSMYAGEDIHQKMQEAGADGFVSKSGSSSEILKAIYGV
jgi:PAS domain S-box-containing protein